jgi:hypothetical protein
MLPCLHASFCAFLMACWAGCEYMLAATRTLLSCCLLRLLDLTYEAYKSLRHRWVCADTPVCALLLSILQAVSRLLLLGGLCLNLSGAAVARVRC